MAVARIDLERGRLRRTSGDREAALTLFESAYVSAVDAAAWFIAADAAHMAALAASGRERFVEWTERGLALADERPEASYWAGPLLNNLGWERYEAGKLDQAFGAFERGLYARGRDPGSGRALALAPLPILVVADPSFETERERSRHLRALASRGGASVDA